MKQPLAIIALFCSMSALAQQTIAYSIETTARPDSFFLVETITQPTDGSPRANVQVNYHLMRDTSELNYLQSRLISAAEEAEARAAEQSARAQIARAQVAAIRAAQQSVFSPPAQPPAQPPAETKKPAPATPPKKSNKKKKS